MLLVAIVLMMSLKTAAADPVEDVSFPAFNRTGIEACHVDDGKPVIFLFSSASCIHCEWAGEFFDFIFHASP